MKYKVCSIVFLAAALSAGSAFAKEKVLVVSAHPDDAIAMAGTMYLMREKFEVHVVDLTSGQLGLGEAGRKDGSTAALAGFAVQGDRCIFTELPRREGRGKE